MYNSKYYTCEQIDQRLLQGYVDDYNLHNGTNLNKTEYLDLLSKYLKGSFEEEIYQAIHDLQVGGVALKDGFGDAEDFGINQKFLSQQILGLIDQLNTERAEREEADTQNDEALNARIDEVIGTVQANKEEIEGTVSTLEQKVDNNKSDVDHDLSNLDGRVTEVDTYFRSVAAMLNNKVDENEADIEGKLSTEISRAHGIENNLQTQINNIISGGSTVSISASPSYVFIGVSTDIIITAKCSNVADEIKVSGGSLSTPAVDHNKATFVVHDSITATAVGTIGNTVTYTGEFTVAGNKLPTTPKATVTGVLPISYGSGLNNESISWISLTTPKGSPSGTYTFNIQQKGSYVYFKMQNSMKLGTVQTVGGLVFTVGFTDLGNNSGGNGYHLYRSNTTFENGSLTLKVS